MLEDKTLARIAKSVTKAFPANIRYTHITSQMKGICAEILDNLTKKIMYIQTFSVLKIQKINKEMECDLCNQFNYLRVLNIAEMNIQKYKQCC